MRSVHDFAADLPHLHSFTNALDLEIHAATAAFTVPTATATPRDSIPGLR